MSNTKPFYEMLLDIQLEQQKINEQIQQKQAEQEANYAKLYAEIVYGNCLAEMNLSSESEN